MRIGRSAARCIRLFPPINPSGFVEGHATVANDRSVYDDDNDDGDEENERRRRHRRRVVANRTSVSTQMRLIGSNE